MKSSIFVLPTHMKNPDNTRSLVNEEDIRNARKNLTYTQRFDLLMKLVRLNKLMKSAKIYTLDKGD